MEDQEFVDRIREKIERLTGRQVELRIDEEDSSQIGVELHGDMPVVILGNHVLEYSGFARMGIEYAVACIREERAIDPVEFHVLLARNQAFVTPEGEPQGPSFPRPWYYRPEYMIPMFVFWSAWAVLVLRSPWNSNVMFGGVAWAVIFVGAVLGFRWLMDENYQPILTLYVPGILLTLITQVQWTRYRHEMAGGDAPADQKPAEARAPERPPRPSARKRRRAPRAGRFKS